MSPTDLQTRHDHLMDLVSKMRYYQQRYAQYKVGSDRNNMRYWQGKVDKLIAQELLEKKKKQSEIF